MLVDNCQDNSGNYLCWDTFRNQSVSRDTRCFLEVIRIKRVDQELALIQALPASLRCGSLPCWEMGSYQASRVTKRDQQAVPCSGVTLGPRATV